MTITELQRIHADDLAAQMEDRRFAAVLDESPRRREMLWFIQWRSWQSGGLDALAEALLESQGHLLGTRSMIAAGTEPWTPEQCWKMWEEVTSAYHPISWGCEFSQWAGDGKDFPNRKDAG